MMTCYWSTKSRLTLFFVSVCLSLTCCWSGCTGDDDDDTSGTVIMPLDTGNQWTYDMTTTAGNGSYVMSVSGREEINGTTVSRIDYSGFYYDDDFWILLANLSDGIHYFGDSIHGQQSPSDLWCPLNPVPGDSWTTSGQDLTMTWDILSIDETLTVPAGTFSCYHLRGTANGVIFETWWAPGVGIVKSVNHYASQTAVLTSFSVTL